MSQTVTFVSFSDTGAAGRLGMYPQAEQLTQVEADRHRPLSFKEAVEYDLNTSTQVWKTTLILASLDEADTAVVVAVQADGELRVDGAAFKVIAGAQVFPDLDGDPFKVTILSQRKVT